MKKLFTTIALAAALFLFGTGASFAADGSIFATITSKINTTLLDLQKVIYIIGGFGLVAFAFAAVFGKISFRHLSYLSFSLFLVAAMGPFVRYFSGDDNAMSPLQYQDYCETHDCNEVPNVPDCEGNNCDTPICPNGDCGNGNGSGGGTGGGSSNGNNNLNPWQQASNFFNNLNHGINTVQTGYNAVMGTINTVSNVINGVQNSGGGFGGVMNALGQIGRGINSVNGYAGSVAGSINSWTNNPGAMNTFNNISSIIYGVGNTANATGAAGSAASNAINNANGTIGGGLNAAGTIGSGAQNVFNNVWGTANAVNRATGQNRP